jgi:hypothetical protein
MYTNRKGLREEDSPTRERFDPVVGDYRLGAYWWEIAEMFRKILLTGMISFWSRGSIQQLTIGIAVSTVFLTLAVKIRPFELRFNNNFKLVTDISIISTFCICILLSDRVDQELEPEWLGKAELDVALVLVNIGFPLAAIISEVGMQVEESNDVEVLGKEDRDGVQWPYARWEEGAFRGAKLGDDHRLAALRLELEGLEIGKLDRRANKVDLTNDQIEGCHSSPFPKEAMVDLIVAVAALEGKGWGCCKSEPIGTVYEAMFAQEIAEAKRLAKRKAEKAIEAEKQAKRDARIATKLGKKQASQDKKAMLKQASQDKKTKLKQASQDKKAMLKQASQDKKRGKSNKKGGKAHREVEFDTAVSSEDEEN